MARRKNTITRFLEDIVDDTKDFVDDLLDRAKDVEEDLRDAAKNVVDDDDEEDDRDRSRNRNRRGTGPAPHHLPTRAEDRMARSVWTDDDRVHDLVDRAELMYLAVAGRLGPHVTPLAFALSDQNVWAVTPRRSAKVRAIRRDARV